jgi:hypothetical protein
MALPLWLREKLFLKSLLASELKAGLYDLLPAMRLMGTKELIIHV